MIIVTFWNADFIGDNHQQLIAILQQYACKGIGCWYITKTNFIQAMLPDESDYTWIMEHVANFGNTKLNK
jgi:cytochrome b subunit of formate dehydrogenase